MATVDRTTAEEEFEKLTQDWDIDVTTGMDDEESKTSFEVSKNRIIRAFQAGRLVYNGDDESLSFTHRGEHVLTFNVPKGNAYLEMDSTKANESIKKLNRFMGSMTQRPPSEFSNMDGRDIKVCQAIAGLFIGG